MYWPGITNDITQFVSQFEACQKHQKRTQKEPLLQPELPCRPWERLSSDLFQYRGHQYLLLSDYYSKFPIIRKLAGTSSLAIINHMKNFCRTWNPLSAHNGQWATVQLPRVSPVYRSLFYRAYHKLPTVPPVKRICRAHGTDRKEHTTQV